MIVSLLTPLLKTAKSMDHWPRCCKLDILARKQVKVREVTEVDKSWMECTKFLVKRYFFFLNLVVSYAVAVWHEPLNLFLKELFLAVTCTLRPDSSWVEGSLLLHAAQLRSRFKSHLGCHYSKRCYWVRILHYWPFRGLHTNWHLHREEDDDEASMLGHARGAWDINKDFFGV